MDWLTFALVNLTWVVSLLLMRRRYRRLLGEAIGTLHHVHQNLTPYVGKEGKMRCQIGVLLSNLCADTRIDPWKRKDKSDAP